MRGHPGDGAGRRRDRLYGGDGHRHPWSRRAGEVLVRVRGGSETFLAWSDEPLPQGASVLVIESRGARQVYVMEWADPLAG